MRSDMGSYEEEVLGKPYDLKLIRQLFPFIKSYSMVFFLSVFLMILITALDLSIPYIKKIAIDRYIVPVVERHTETGDTTAGIKQNYIRIDDVDPDIRQIIDSHQELFDQQDGAYQIDLIDLENLTVAERTRLRARDLDGLILIACGLIIIVVLLFVLNFIQKLVMEYAGQKIMHDLRMHLFNHIQSLPVSFFNRNPVGRLVTRATNDIQNLHEMFTSVIVFLFKDLFLISGIAIVLLLISWRLALVSFTVLPFVMYASFYFARHARDVFRELRVKVSQINTRFSETIQGIKVIQLFRHEHRNALRFRDLNHENYLAGMKQIHIFAVFMPVIEVLGSVTLAVIIFYGGKGVVSDTITLGDFIAFVFYMKMFFRPVRDIAEKYNILQNSLASAERIFQVLDETEGLEHGESVPESSAPESEPIDTIAFQHVTFSYTAGEPVLKEITFSVRKGETLAVVGPTGAGKTSLINLLVRFYDPVSGKILFNGKDIRTLDHRALRSRVALVNQDPFLFSGTIRNNILAGSSPGSGHSLEEILTISNCHTFVNRLPQGADTILTEGAGTLSSGERQLISIARAIAGNPDLIILDEATSYIDTESEVKIQEALNNLMASRTSVVIAHRMSTARSADTILVMNRGRIAESGNHQSLMAENGLYRRLAQAHDINNSATQKSDVLRRYQS